MSFVQYKNSKRGTRQFFLYIIFLILIKLHTRNKIILTSVLRWISNSI